MSHFGPGQRLSLAIAPAPALTAKFAGLCAMRGCIAFLPSLFGLRPRRGGVGWEKRKLLLPLCGAFLLFLGAMQAVPAPAQGFTLDIARNLVSRTLNTGATIPFSSVSDVTLLNPSQKDENLSTCAVYNGGQTFKLMDAQAPATARSIKTAIQTFIDSSGNAY